MSTDRRQPFIVAIPARYASTRLPAKPLRLIAGDPMVVHVARRALAAGAAEVVVATDDGRIAKALEGAGVTVCFTDPAHTSGTDRLAEVAAKLKWPDATIVVNLQGDEPLAPPSGIQAVAAALLDDSGADMATLAMPIESAEELFNPNCVKLATDKRGRALYFSRAPIPWHRDHFATDREHLPHQARFLRHIGIYAYRAGFLRTFAGLERGSLEQTESLEQLRALEHGHVIAVRQAPEAFPAGVDTEADLVRVIRLMGGA